MKKYSPLCETYKPHNHFKLYFQNVNQRTGGKCLIHGTKYRNKHNQLQSQKLHCRIIS